MDVSWNRATLSYHLFLDWDFPPKTNKPFSDTPIYGNLHRHTSVNEQQWFRDLGPCVAVVGKMSRGLMRGQQRPWYFVQPTKDLLNLDQRYQNHGCNIPMFINGDCTLPLQSCLLLTLSWCHLFGGPVYPNIPMIAQYSWCDTPVLNPTSPFLVDKIIIDTLW